MRVYELSKNRKEQTPILDEMIFPFDHGGYGGF